MRRYEGYSQVIGTFRNSKTDNELPSPQQTRESRTDHGTFAGRKKDCFGIRRRDSGDIRSREQVGGRCCAPFAGGCDYSYPRCFCGCRRREYFWIPYGSFFVSGISPPEKKAEKIF